MQIEGSGGETPEQVRQNAPAFNLQNRAATKEDYIVRVYSLPQKYGVAKCFIVQDEQLEVNTQTIMKQGKLKTTKHKCDTNPLTLNMYVLGYDGSNHLVA